MEDTGMPLELSETDMASMEALGALAKERGVDELIEPFYVTLKEDDNADVVDEYVDKITDLLRTALQSFFSDADMATKQEKIADLIRLLVGLGIKFDTINKAYFRLFLHSMGVLGQHIQHLEALVKTMYLWSSVTISVFYQELEKSRELIEEISTPIQSVWDKIISMPMVGHLDSSRFAVIEETLLEAVDRYAAAYVIIDVAGVDYLDSDVASHFIKLIQAINLMGTGAIIVGIGSNMSRAFVRLDVDLSGLNLKTFATFKQGLTYAFDRLGVTTVDRRAIK